MKARSASTVPVLPPGWLVALVNEYAPRPREAAGEADEPYPDPGFITDELGLNNLRNSDLVTIATQLWPIFASPENHERAGQLNTLLKRAHLTPSISEDGQLEWMSTQLAPRGHALAVAAVSLLDVVESRGWTRAGVCNATDCQDIYIDLERRGARRYCSRTCLNRTRVRAFRARQPKS